MLGYIPSPSTNGISLGPLRLHMYGFLIVAGVFAAVWLADRRWQARGGEPGTFSAIALWAVPGGLIGARIYHVVTDYELYTHHPLGALEIWNGGLGIWGGIAGGALAAWLYVRRRHLDFPAIMDTVAPALPLAQAIGRWGNYFNQELFGRPTTLPWGVKIGLANRPDAYKAFATFHPTFLYESLWDLAVVGLVLLAERHLRLRKGYLFGVYVACYTFGRFFTEYMRIDFAHKILGLRINDWVSVIIFVVATAIVLRKGLIRRKSAEQAVARDRVSVGASGGDTLAEPAATNGTEEVELFGAAVTTTTAPPGEPAPPPPKPEPTAAEAAEPEAAAAEPPLEAAAEPEAATAPEAAAAEPPLEAAAEPEAAAPEAAAAEPPPEAAAEPPLEAAAEPEAAAAVAVPAALPVAGPPAMAPNAQPAVEPVPGPAATPAADPVITPEPGAPAAPVAKPRDGAPPD